MGIFCFEGPSKGDNPAHGRAMELGDLLGPLQAKTFRDFVSLVGAGTWKHDVSFHQVTFYLGQVFLGRVVITRPRHKKCAGLI